MQTMSISVSKLECLMWIWIGVAVVCSANNEEKDNHPIKQKSKGMGLELATIAIESAMAATENATSPMNIAIVDSGAHLVSFARMDGAWLGSVDIAIRKAKTAVFFNMPYSSIGELSQPGGSLYNIEHSNGGLITF